MIGTKLKMIAFLLTGCLILTSLPPAAFSAVNRKSFSMKAPEYTPLTTSLSKSKKIESYKKGNLLLSQGYYRDAASAGISAQVAKLTAFGVIDRKSDYFQPYKTLDGYNAIEMITGLTGQKEVVRKRASINANLESKPIAERILLREFFIEGKNKGYILPREEKYINENVPKYVFTAWLARAAGIQPKTPIENGAKSFTDYESIPTDYRDIVEGVYEAGILKSGGQFDPHGYVNKLQAAVMLEKALPLVYENLGITVDTGLVILKKNSIKNSFSKKTAIDSTYMINKSGKPAVILARHTPSAASRTNFIYNNHGALSNAGGINKGHEIKFYKKNGRVVYAVKTTGDTVFKSIQSNALKRTDLTFSHGLVVNKKSEFFVEKGKKYFTNRIRVQNYNGDVIDMVVKNKVQMNIANNLMIMKNGVPQTLNSLAKGDYLEYYSKEPNKIVFAFMKKEDFTSKKGQIVDIRLDSKERTAPGVISLYDTGGSLVHIPVARYANFDFNGTTGTLGDLMKGQFGNFTMKNGYIMGGTVDSYDSSGYIPEMYKKRSGTVTYISSSKLTIKEVGGSKTTFAIGSSSTAFKKSLSPATYKDVSVGDRVDVYLDDPGTAKPSLVQIYGTEKPSKAVYKGVIQSVDNGIGKLAVSDAAYLTNSLWENDTSYVKEFAFTDTSIIYDGKSRISPAKLTDSYKGKTVYMALKNTYGDDEIEQAVISTGAERNYNSKVSTVDTVGGQMELRNKLNFALTPATIVIKDGKILPFEYIKNNQDVLVVSSTSSSSPYACVVSIVDSVFVPFEGIYMGALNDVTPYSFNLTDYSVISGKKITKPSTEPSDYFNMNNATSIYDRTLGKYISMSDLYHGNYSSGNNLETAPSEGMKQKYYFGVFLTDRQGEALAVNIMKNALVKGTQLTDNPAVTNETRLRTVLENMYSTVIFTKGDLAEVDASQKRLRITNSHDYSAASDMWKPLPENVWVRYDDAVIYKDGKSITADRLSYGDSLNIVRLTDKSLAIVVD